MVCRGGRLADILTQRGQRFYQIPIGINQYYRLERGGFKKASVETLRKIADVLDARLVVKLQPKKVKHLAVR